MQIIRFTVQKEVWEALVNLSIDEVRPAKMQAEKIFCEKLIELGYLTKNSDGTYTATNKKENNQ